MSRPRRIGAGVLALFLLTSCGAPDGVDRISADAASIADEGQPAEGLVMSDMGRWDGRPTLGGVWVAHHDVQEPMSVLIRSTANGKSVTGGLFRQAADNGSRGFTLSSDAAAALEMPPNSPASITVSQAVRDDAGAAAQAPEADDGDEAAGGNLLLAESAAPGTLLYRGMAKPPQAAAELPPTGGEILRIATFGIEANAQAAQARLAKAGVRATITPGGGRNNPLWAVTAGPARNDTEKSALVAKVKSAGFPDAYFTGQ